MPRMYSLIHQFNVLMTLLIHSVHSSRGSLYRWDYFVSQSGQFQVFYAGISTGARCTTMWICCPPGQQLLQFKYLLTFWFQHSFYANMVRHTDCIIFDGLKPRQSPFFFFVRATRTRTVTPTTRRILTVVFRTSKKSLTGIARPL